MPSNNYFRVTSFEDVRPGLPAIVTFRLIFFNDDDARSTRDAYADALAIKEAGVTKKHRMRLLVCYPSPRVIVPWSDVIVPEGRPGTKQAA